MKNIKLYFGLILLAGLLLMGGCSDVYDSPGQDTAIEGETVTITINDNTGRTLLPGAQSFSYYELTFTPSSGTPIDPVIVYGSGSHTQTLGTGWWYVRAKAFVYISGLPGIEDGYYEAASSGNVSFNVVSGGSSSVSISVSARMQEEEKGIFSWDIQSDVTLTQATLDILDAWEDPIEIDGVTFEQINLMENWWGTIALDPGYYMIKVELTNTDGNKAYKTEIMHIYSSITTSADSGTGYHFDSSNFAPMTNISGTVQFDASVMLEVDSVLNIYADSEYNNQITTINNLSNANLNWNCKIHPNITSVYLTLDVRYYDYPAFVLTKGPVSVTSTDPSDWNLNAALLHRSGIVEIGDPLTIEYKTMELYSNPRLTDEIFSAPIVIADDGSWSVTLTPDYSAVYLKATVKYDNIADPVIRTKGPVNTASVNAADWAVNCLPPNTGIIIGDPSVKLFLNGGITALTQNGITFIEYAASGTFTVSIASGAYSQIKWFVNGNLAAEGAARTSIVLPKRTPGTYLVTVEATAEGAANTGTHTFVVVQE